jgi:hypothetical protein
MAFSLDETHRLQYEKPGPARVHTVGRWMADLLDVP